MIRYGTGERTPHYDQVRTLNLRVKPLGETLAGLAWLTTEHAGGTPIGGTTFSADSLVAGWRAVPRSGRSRMPRARRTCSSPTATRRPRDARARARR